MEVEKNEKFAEQYRNEGNQHYMKGEFFKALESYNKSLCFAKSSQLSLAYSNRSAVYFEMKRYEKCLENIQLARENNYPVDKLPILQEREQKCLKMLESKPDEFDNTMHFFKLSYPPNKKIPFIADCLELHEDEKFDRHIITNKDLVVGDIIAIEEPFYKFLNRSVSYKRCSYCLKSSLLSLVPCPSCTSTMFCSTECMKLNHFHNLQCQSSDGVDASNEMLFRISRMCVETLENCNYNWNKIKELLNPPSPKKTIFDLDLSDPNDSKENDYNLTLVIHSLHKNEDDLSLLRHGLANNNRIHLSTLIDEQMKIMNTNAFAMHRDSDDSHFGAGLFAFGSLFNHSCSPNVDRIAVDNKLAFYVRTPIKANEQLFIAYTCSFLECPREKRQKSLLRGYKFDCDCIACIKYFPLLKDLKKNDPSFVLPHIPITVEERIQVFRNNCKYIERNFHHYPSFEICTLIAKNLWLLENIAKVQFG